MQSPYLTGATMYAEAIGEFEPVEVMLGEIRTKAKFEIKIGYSGKKFNTICCKVSYVS